MGFNSTQLAQASLVTQIGGAATSAVGSYYGAKSQVSSMQFQAGMADINTRIAELGAQQELYKGQQQTGTLTMKAGQIKSSQRAAMAANGIDLGEGNAAEVQASTDIMKEVDKNTIEANAVRSAWGYRTQGVNYQNDALVKRAGADSISPFASAATSLLGSASGVAGSWYNYSRNRDSIQAPAPVESRSW
ncbi:phage protein [Sulfurimicrobium lacus]|uniref:Phage protein n=1 Tax=Sulfurimicrobium lacus TaxID=2715678 RepID=A0A6F8VD79_9PROT|nr:hypothetical protein [Sulfurimicrobium lacus]BCB27057.1 phage protein [Sulfurimicrobium lacus]